MEKKLHLSIQKFKTWGLIAYRQVNTEEERSNILGEINMLQIF